MLILRRQGKLLSYFQPICRLIHTGRIVLRKTSVAHEHSSVSGKVHKVVPLFLKAEEHLDSTAVRDKNGNYKYLDILKYSYSLAKHMKKQLNSHLYNERICFLCGNDAAYVVTKLATWIVGGVAVPLSISHPPTELEYFITDSDSKLLVYAEEYENKVQPLLNKVQIASLKVTNEKLLDCETDSLAEMKQGFDNVLDSNVIKEKNALIIYTSGTTGKPKGVVHTFGSLDAQMQSMIKAWSWSRQDTVLHVLPLHHVHGIVNVLMTPLYVGAQCVMLPKFDAAKVWSLLTKPGTNEFRAINVFMAVPTIYAKLLTHMENKGIDSMQLTKNFIKTTCSTQIRLMVSGSAALPEPVLSAWEKLTGHRLLERYGMTEIGMALTNPLNDIRLPGAVGKPFPKVKVCLATPNAYAETGYDIMVTGSESESVLSPGYSEGEPGELLIKGPNVFKEYWKRPKETHEAFTKDGWFKTGDTAIYKDGVYRILGRTSVDIIKTGGFKVSALDIEQQLLSHPDIVDVAVVGIVDMTWGQKIAAVCVLKTDQSLTIDQLRQFCSDKMAPYQIPVVLKVLETIPRNAMGKVNKKELVTTVFGKENQQYS